MFLEESANQLNAADAPKTPSNAGGSRRTLRYQDRFREKLSTFKSHKIIDGARQSLITKNVHCSELGRGTGVSLTQAASPDGPKVEQIDTKPMVRENEKGTPVASVLDPLRLSQETTYSALYDYRTIQKASIAPGYGSQTRFTFLTTLATLAQENARQNRRDAPIRGTPTRLVILTLVVQDWGGSRQ